MSVASSSCKFVDCSSLDKLILPKSMTRICPPLKFLCVTSRPKQAQPFESQAARSCCLDFVSKSPSTFERYGRLTVFCILLNKTCKLIVRIYNDIDVFYKI